MRLFVAIDLPKEIKDKIAYAFAYTKDALDFAGFTLSQNLHITLSFLGEISQSEEEKIKKYVKEASSKHKKHLIFIKNAVIGPSETNPKMIWLKLNENSHKYLLPIAKDIKECLKKHKIPFDNTHEELNSHITLARFSDRWQRSFLEKNEKQKGEDIKLIKESLPESCEFEFEASSIVLFQSTQENGERVYTSLFESVFNG